MSKAKNLITQMKAKVKGEIKNLQYGTIEGEDLEIYQVDETKITKGDKTNVEEGEFTLNNGVKIKIENWEVVEINSDVQGGDGGGEAPKPELDENGNPIPQAGEFNEGQAPKIDDEDEAAKAAKAAEELEKEKEQPVAPVVPEETEEEKAAKASELEKQMEEKEKKDGSIEELATTVKQLQEQNKKMAAELEGFREAKTSETLQSLTASMEKISDDIKNIQVLQTSNQEDIEAVADGVSFLADNTSSTFEPVARAQAKKEDLEVVGGTPFQIAKMNQIKARQKAKGSKED